METKKKPTINFDRITLLSVVVLVLIVTFASLPPLASQFSSAATWISLLLILCAFLIPYYLVKKDQDAGRVLLMIVNGIAVLLTAACVIFSFIVMRDYSPKGLLFAVIISCLVYILLALLWFSSAFTEETAVPQPTQPFQQPDSPVAGMMPDLSQNQSDIKRITIIDMEKRVDDESRQEAAASMPQITVVPGTAAPSPDALPGDDPANPRLDQPRQ
jgi:hypothetical protein